MGATIEDSFSKKVTHVFAMNVDSLLQKIDRERLTRSKAVSLIVELLLFMRNLWSWVKT